MKTYVKLLVRKIYPYFLPLVARIKKYLKDIKDDVAFLDLGLGFEEYLTLILFLTIIISIFAIIFILIILYLIINYIDIFIVLLAIIYGLLVGSLVFVYFITYPKLAKNDYIKEIEDNLPLFLIYFYGLVSSGINIANAFKIASKRKEFGKLSKDIKFLVRLIEDFGYDVLTALIILAKKTPSQKFKEFLYELISVIRSGGSLKEIVREIAKGALYDYELKLKSFIEKSGFLLTIYTFVFIAFPLTLLILAFLLSIAAESYDIITTLIPFFLGFIPMAYLIYLYVIYLLQPSL